MNPDALRVVDGRLPIDEVRKITPQLEDGAAALASARTRLDDLRADPYLVEQVRDAVDKVYGQLARADREAAHAAAAAKLAPAIFGADGVRTYLLVVQNNAESRATGGFIGSFALMTAHDGEVDVGEMQRTSIWNEAIATQASVNYEAPTDYTAPIRPVPAAVDLAEREPLPRLPQCGEGVGEPWRPRPDSRRSTGCCRSTPPGWPRCWSSPAPSRFPAGRRRSTAAMSWTSRCATPTPRSPRHRNEPTSSATSPRPPSIAATTGTLGTPAQIAKVLGAAAHAGHLQLGFTRPEEEALATELGISGRLEPVNSDALAVTTSNFAGNKIDYYLNRSVDYRVQLTPNDAATKALANAELSVALDNTAPTEGLPRVVIGPYTTDRFVAGENRTLLSLYSPLKFAAATVDGVTTSVTPGRERGRNVYSLIERIPSRTQKTTVAKLVGPVELHHGWYSLQVRAQPTLNVDRVQVSVEVPEGWMIDKAPNMDMVFAAPRQRQRLPRQDHDVPRAPRARRQRAEPLGSARQRHVNRSARRTINLFEFSGWSQRSQRASTASQICAPSATPM